MRGKKRTVLAVLSSVAGLFLLSGALLFYVVQTGALKNRIRLEIVSALERASGGRVELQSFDFDWRTLSVRVNSLVIHGTELPESPPLLQVASVVMRLKITSLLERRVDVSSVVADRVSGYLLIRPDGSTNIPEPHFRDRKLLDKIFDLEIKHFEFNRGILLVNAKPYSFNIQGQDLRALATYRQSAYQLSLASRLLQLSSTCCRNLPFSLEASATLGKNVIEFRQVLLTTAGSKVQLSGKLRHFDRPEGDFQFQTSVSAKQASQILEVYDLRGGDIAVVGSAHFDESRGLSAQGRLQGHDLLYRFPKVGASSLELSSLFKASSKGLTFTDIVAKAFGGRFVGNGTLDFSRSVELTGRVYDINLRRLLVTDPRLSSWTGLISGPVALSAQSTSGFIRRSVRSTLRITGSAGATPVSGVVDLAENERSAISFGNSHLTLPDSEISFQGSIAAGLKTKIESTNPVELKPILALFNVNNSLAGLPALLSASSIHFAGTVQLSAMYPSLEGALTLTGFELAGRKWNLLQTRGTLNAQSLDLASLTLDSSPLHFSGAGRLNLRGWQFSKAEPLRLQGDFRGIELKPVLSTLGATTFPVERGTASGTVAVSGPLDRLSGTLSARVQDPSAYGEPFQEFKFSAISEGGVISIPHATLQALNGDRIAFTAVYTPAAGTLRDGRLSVSAASNAFAIANLSVSRQLGPDLKATLDFDTRVAGNFVNGAFSPEEVNGRLSLDAISTEGMSLGAAKVRIITEGRTLNVAVQGDLRESNFHGDARIALAGDQDVKGELRLQGASLATINDLLAKSMASKLPLAGSLDAAVDFAGPLRHPSLWSSSIHLDRLKLTPFALSPGDHGPIFELHNARSALVQLSNGQLNIPDLELVGQDTRLVLNGSVGYLQHHPLNLTAKGSVDLQLLAFLDPGLRSSGQSLLNARLGGTLALPSVEGRWDFKDASFESAGLANALRDVNGSVTFKDNRATLENVTGTSGGGLIKLGGFVAYNAASRLIYNLNARAENVRIAYSGVSLTTNTDLRLTGTTDSSLLSGTTTVSRVVFNPNTDVGSVLTNFATPLPTPANKKDFLTGMHLDVGIESAPTLQLSTALSHDVEAEIDLRLRGTPDRPVLLGSVSANQGDIRVFGTRYSINRGEVNFVNTARIDPVLDLDLQTQTRGITVDITITGTLNRLDIAYRSDPPLQPRDIIALLTVGRTPQQASNVQNTQVSTDTTGLQSGANNVLGQAISQPPSRLSKLFGVTNIRLDPLVQGISNTTQSRLTLEQQVSRAITVTYVTNLEQTSEQIFRLEWSINRQYSVVAIRDDNGEFGLDIQYKKSFK